VPEQWVSLTVFDTANPYQSVELRGTAELTGDPGKSLPRALSQKYLGEDPPPEPDEPGAVAAHHPFGLRTGTSTALTVSVIPATIGPERTGYLPPRRLWRLTRPVVSLNK
jgi:hypothetical protein